jgi:hypothetical protein
MTNENSISTKADFLLAVMHEKLGTDDPEVILEDIKMTSAEYLEEKFSDKFDGWTKDELHAAIVAVISKLEPGDGIEFAGHENEDNIPVWLGAIQVEDGRLPSKDPGKRRWIRLDTITMVFSNPNFATDDDPRNWLSSVTFRSDGSMYHASPVLFRGDMANAAVQKVLRAVARVVGPKA